MELTKEMLEMRMAKLNLLSNLSSSPEAKHEYTIRIDELKAMVEVLDYEERDAGRV